MLRRSVLLAWLVAILGVIVPCVAWAATTARLETRVRGFELVVPTLIGRSTARTPEKHREKSNAYDEIASGSPLAAEGATMMDTAAIRFTQSSVRGTFADGRSLQSTIEALSGAEGDAIASQIPPIRVFEREGQLFTLDNRRLLTFSGAGRQVPVIMIDAETAAAEAWKFTATPEQAGGWFIRVKP